jgi:hypothetical protein
MRFPQYPTDFISSQQWWVLICIQESKPSISGANDYTKNLHPEYLHFPEAIRNCGFGKHSRDTMTNYNESHSMLIQAAAIRRFKDRTL